MVNLNPQLFGAQPRKELGKSLDALHQIHLGNLLGHEPSDLNKPQRLRLQVELGVIQALKSLTLPNPIRTWLVPKSKLPSDPLSYRQLKDWVDSTILSLTQQPHSDDYTTLVVRQHTLYLLSKIKFTEE